MVPTTWLAVLFYTLLVAPGLLYDLLAERRRVRANESVFREASRTVLASLVISVAAFSILAIVRSVHPAWMPDSGQLFANSAGYVAGHYRLILRTLLIEGGIALGIAGGLQWMRLRRVRSRLRPISTWTKVFREECPPGYVPHVQVRLSNGITYIGRVGYFTADLESSDRELILVPPLYVKRPDSNMKDMAPEWQRVVVSGDSLESMVVQYRPDPCQPKPSPGLVKRFPIHLPVSNSGARFRGKLPSDVGEIAPTATQTSLSTAPSSGVQTSPGAGLAAAESSSPESN